MRMHEVTGAAWFDRLTCGSHRALARWRITTLVTPGRGREHGRSRPRAGTFALMISPSGARFVTISWRSRPSMQTICVGCPRNATRPSGENPESLTSRPRDHDALRATFPEKVSRSPNVYRLILPFSLQ